MVIALLAAKNAQAPDDVVRAEVARLNSKQHRTVVRYLARADVDLSALEAEAPIAAQMFLARLDRRGVASIGLPSCASCRQRRLLRCRDAKHGRICNRCREGRYYGVCHQCTHMKKLSTDDGIGHRLCQRCSAQQLAMVTYAKCGKEVTVTTKLDGTQVCLNCYPRKLRTCSACGQARKIASHISGSAHCFACHNKVLRNPSPCRGCGHTRILAFLDEQHTPVCAGCAGQPARYACRRCGSEEHHYGRLCGKCVLGDRLNDVLADPYEQVTQLMQMLYAYLMQQPRPAQIIKWLHMGPHTDLLRDIATEAKPLTEETFTAAVGGKGLLYLRALLADSGALPLEHTDLARLREWCDTHLQTVPAAQRLIISQYLQWDLMRRAKRDNRTGDITSGAAKHVQAVIRGIANFINWLNSHEHTGLLHE